MTRMSPIQSLYELCKNTFASSSSGTVASPQAIRKLRSLLDTIVPADVGLKDENEDDDRGHGFFGESLFKNYQSIRTSRWAQPITYLHIYENDKFTIGIFCLPTSSTIPLHDHPGMTVLSKILYGSMHVKAYDWTEPPYVQSGRQEQCSVRLAKLHMDTVLSAPCPTSVLYPERGGNLHCFTAVTSCAILDVLAPPYSDVAGRFCTYYNDYPYSSFLAPNTEHDEAHENIEDYAWIEEIKAPSDLYIRSGTYTGPTVKL